MRTKIIVVAGLAVALLGVLSLGTAAAEPDVVLCIGVTPGQLPQVGFTCHDAEFCIVLDTSDLMMPVQLTGC
jgi:hypothetical protein